MTLFRLYLEVNLYVVFLKLDLRKRNRYKYGSQCGLIHNAVLKHLQKLINESVKIHKCF